MDLVVNTLTIAIAAFATGRIAKRMGLPFTLASVPVLIGAGFMILAAAPMVSIVVAIQVIRRAGNPIQSQASDRYRYLPGGRYAERLGHHWHLSGGTFS